jgi:hypothetical protein
LPTHTYPERGGILIIWFPPVPHAIAIKLHYDPSEGNGKDLVVITAEARLSLIRKAKEEIDRIKRE